VAIGRLTALEASVQEAATISLVGQVSLEIGRILLVGSLGREARLRVEERLNKPLKSGVIKVGKP
jgi:hypothetical protein